MQDRSVVAKVLEFQPPKCWLYFFKVAIFFEYAEHQCKDWKLGIDTGQAMISAFVGKYYVVRVFHDSICV